jgi:hypothetical protein
VVAAGVRSRASASNTFGAAGTESRSGVVVAVGRVGARSMVDLCLFLANHFLFGFFLFGFNLGSPA